MDDPWRLLRETELFSGIDAATADKLAGRLVRKVFPKGQPLFHQGDPGDALYILVDGSVSVVMSSENGDRMVLTTLHPPDVLGQIALLDGGSRSATAEAVEHTTTLMLSRAAFQALMKEHPPLVDQMLRGLGAIVRRLSEQASDFVFLDLPGRVAKVLIRLAEDTAPVVDGVPVELTVTQKQLAEMAGGSRQSVNQILQQFQQRGLVELIGRRVLVYRPDQLRRRAGLSG
ncbi:MAG TPA: Crp/Fnr family transcriptional regulator [Mycobacteriales bacterium]|nr:Crp/Fnr family transcriptional regulator [Mycobacteriales bacterium]